MQRKAFLLSLGLHTIIICLMFADFHFSREYTKAPPAILMVDLTKVKIANKTNLPQKAVVQKKQPKKEEPKPIPKVDKPTQEVKKEEPKPEPKPAPVPKDAVAVQPKKDEKKKEPEKPESKQKPKKPDYDLKSLLASVEKIRQENTSPSTDQNPEALDNGMEGRIDKLLTISDKDFIRSKLRDCWYIDGGAQNIDEITVEIRVLINKDGSIRDAKIMNNMNLPAFKSLSESAKRAVYICAQKGDESPFKILADNYADHYQDWKELYLNFNPMDANVF